MREILGMRESGEVESLLSSHSFLVLSPIGALSLELTESCVMTGLLLVCVLPNCIPVEFDLGWIDPC